MFVFVKKFLYFFFLIGCFLCSQAMSGKYGKFVKFKNQSKLEQNRHIKSIHVY